MRVLWLCNICLPIIAKHLGIDAGNKEGWLSGLSERLLKDNNSNIELGVCFPGPKELEHYQEKFEVSAYSFYEDTAHPERDCDGAIPRMKEILEDFKPDVVHIFGTEFPHTLAMVKAFDNPAKTLIGIQGLCFVYADAYLCGLPKEVYSRRTLRDRLKKDDILSQQAKFVKRGTFEKEALRRTGNVTGRTDWDFKYTKECNPNVRYHFMNETLRSNFYEGDWSYEKCEQHSIFVSQGDYPIKGLHFLLAAMPQILEEYPDTKVYVSGNCIIGDTTKKKLKISSYGKYLENLISQNHLKDNVIFTGSLNAVKMKERFLQSNVFVCPSSMENSPNSLGEAMLLGVPVVSTRVGGVEKLCVHEEEGILYDVTNRNELADAVIRTFDAYEFLDSAKEHTIRMNESQAQRIQRFVIKAKAHAMKTHNADTNYQRLLEIYEDILNESNLCI